ncbi:MAG: N-acetylmuramoyl-L-alanine amidase [Deltaproteobacteria bacterium]|nr:N-acetylmuramoyl-L-alanine amidase [Deltaproteobacteria bacterium]
MNRMAKIITFFLICNLNLLSAEPIEEKFLELKNRFAELKQDKKKRLYRVHWSKVSKELLELAEKAEPKLRVRIYFVLGELYRELRKITLSPYDFESAVEYYKKVSFEFPESNLADDALYYLGKLYLEVENDTDMAIKYFKMIKEKYPKGDYFDKAITILNSVPDAYNLETQGAEVTDSGIEVKDTEDKTVKAKMSEQGVEGEPTKTLFTLNEIKLQVGEKGAICELFVTGQVRYLYKELPEDIKAQKPPRIYIDLIDTKLSEGINKFYAIERGFLRTVRVGQFADNTVRIVFDLLSIQTYLIYSAEKPERIIIHFGELTDLKPYELKKTEIKRTSDVDSQTLSKRENKSQESPEEEINKTIVESIKNDLKKNISEKKTDTIPLSKQLGLKVKKIVIDPGHGGDDQGAVGKTGLKEKDVTLDIAIELAKIIKKNTDIEVILTRDSDVNVKLSERAAIAREKKADLFLSIHVNANKNKKYSGVEVYYLNNTDDRASQKVAMLENINSDKSISDLKMTLLDLAISANVDESMRLAQFVQSGIINKVRKKYPDVKDRGVKYALFYVLFGTDIPSILIEASFISNPVEEKRLKTREYKRLIAEGIFDGVMRYINISDE